MICVPQCHPLLSLSYTKLLLCPYRNQAYYASILFIVCPIRLECKINDCYSNKQFLGDVYLLNNRLYFLLYRKEKSNAHHPYNYLNELEVCKLFCSFAWKS